MVSGIHTHTRTHNQQKLENTLRPMSISGVVGSWQMEMSGSTRKLELMRNRLKTQPQESRTIHPSIHLPRANNPAAGPFFNNGLGACMRVFLFCLNCPGPLARGPVVGVPLIMHCLCAAVWGPAGPATHPAVRFGVRRCCCVQYLAQKDPEVHKTRQPGDELSRRCTMSEHERARDAGSA